MSITTAVTEPLAAQRKIVTGWPLVVILGGLSAFSPLAIDMYVPAFPRIAALLAAPIGQVQLTLSVFLLGLAAGQLLWGTLSDRLGRRVPLILGCALFILAAMTCAWAPSIGWLIAARFLMGFGGSSGVVVSRAIARDLFEEHDAARFFSSLMIVGGIAPIIAPTLGGLLLKYFEWRAIFWVLASFGGVCLAAVAYKVPETFAPRRQARGGVYRSYWRVLTDSNFAVHTLACGLNSGVLFAYISGSPFIFIELYGLSPQRYGLIFGSNAIGLYLAGQTNRWLLSRFKPRQILATAGCGSALIGALLVSVTAAGQGRFWVFFPLLFCCVTSLGFVFPNATAAALQSFRTEAGSASALLGTIQFAVGAVAGGLVAYFHNGTALPMATVIAVCAGGSWLAARSAAKQEGRNG